MQVTATQAKNRFGAICAEAKIAPVYVEKDGRIDTVIVSAQQFDSLKRTAEAKSLAPRKRSFDKTHGVWLAEQNSRFETYGLWCDDMRVW
jgi:PHD/YefM family antitoxin component YafN of YafNO toxin-antitoxin module